MAFKYLSWLLYPLLGCYAVYSLLYVEHKGWYSWILSMLYGFLLTFGESLALVLEAREAFYQVPVSYLHARPVAYRSLITFLPL